MDSISAAGATIAHDLTRKLGHHTAYASCADEVFRYLKSEQDAVGIIVFFLEAIPEVGVAFVRKVREFCSFAAIRCPRFLVLTPGNLRLGYRHKFRTFGAECIVYGFPEQLYATAGEMIFEATCENGKPTFVVERMAHNTKFWLLGPAGRELIAIGPRQFSILNCFAINFGTELSTADLAESADITLASVRVYLDRLRERFNEAAQKVGVTIAAHDVFCTFRKDGGFVHLLRARVLFI
jgi:hypothetical protein